MIDSGKRVVVFLDAGADDGGVDFILPEFPNVRSQSVPQIKIPKFNLSLVALGTPFLCYRLQFPVLRRPHRR